MQWRAVLGAMALCAGGVQAAGMLSSDASAHAAAFLRFAGTADALRRAAHIPGLALAVRHGAPGASGLVMTRCIGVTDVDAPQAVTTC